MSFWQNVSQNMCWQFIFLTKCLTKNYDIMFAWQGGTKCWSVAATLHKNLSFGRKSWPPTYAVLSQNQLCCKLRVLIVWLSWHTTYTFLSRNHLCFELRTGFLSEIFVSDFHLRFLSEIFVWDFFSELGWKDKFLEKPKVQPGIFTTQTWQGFMNQTIPKPSKGCKLQDQDFRLRFYSKILVWNWRLRFWSEILVWDFGLRYLYEIFV